MNFEDVDLFISRIIPLSKDQLDVLQPGPSNPSAHTQDNMTTSQLRMLLAELLQYARKNALSTREQFASARESNTIFFPDDQAFENFCSAQESLRDQLDGYRGVFFISEAALLLYLSNFIDKSHTTYCFHSLDVGYVVKENYQADMAALLSNFVYSQPSEVEKYMRDAVVSLALYIAVTAGIIIPLHQLEDGTHISYVLNVPEYNDQHISLTALISKMISSRGPKSVAPLIHWFDLQGILSRSMYTATLSYKKDLDEALGLSQQLADQVAQLKLQTSGAPGLTWTV